MTGGSGATSPNDSDNTYAEASLLAHVRYEHNNTDGSGQNLRYDQGNIVISIDLFSSQIVHFHTIESIGSI